MKTKTSFQNASEEKIPCQRKSSSLRKTLSSRKQSYEKKRATNETKTTPPMDVCSRCTYHLVQNTLEAVEKLLTHLTSKQKNSRSRKIENTRIGGRRVSNQTVTKGKTEIESPELVADKNNLSKLNMQGNTEKDNDCNKTVTKYRWVAEVREGAPGFADDDRCTGAWFNTREAAGEDMNNNVEKQCRERFPYLRWITNVDIEEKIF